MNRRKFLAGLMASVAVTPIVSAVDEVAPDALSISQVYDARTLRVWMNVERIKDLNMLPIVVLTKAQAKVWGPVISQRSWPVSVE